MSRVLLCTAEEVSKVFTFVLTLTVRAREGVFQLFLLSFELGVTLDDFVNLFVQLSVVGDNWRHVRASTEMVVVDVFFASLLGLTPPKIPNQIFLLSIRKLV